MLSTAMALLGNSSEKREPEQEVRVAAHSHLARSNSNTGARVTQSRATQQQTTQVKQATVAPLATAAVAKGDAIESEENSVKQGDNCAGNWSNWTETGTINIKGHRRGTRLLLRSASDALFYSGKHHIIKRSSSSISGNDSQVNIDETAPRQPPQRRLNNQSSIIHDSLSNHRLTGKKTTHTLSETDESVTVGERTTTHCSPGRVTASSETAVNCSAGNRARSDCYTNTLNINKTTPVVTTTASSDQSVLSAAKLAYHPARVVVVDKSSGSPPLHVVHKQPRSEHRQQFTAQLLNTINSCKKQALLTTCHLATTWDGPAPAQFRRSQSFQVRTSDRCNNHIAQSAPSDGSNNTAADNKTRAAFQRSQSFTSREKRYVNGSAYLDSTIYVNVNTAQKFANHIRDLKMDNNMSGYNSNSQVMEYNFEDFRPERYDPEPGFPSRFAASRMSFLHIPTSQSGRAYPVASSAAARSVVLAKEEGPDDGYESPGASDLTPTSVLSTPSLNNSAELTGGGSTYSPQRGHHGNNSSSNQGDVSTGNDVSSNDSAISPGLPRGADDKQVTENGEINSDFVHDNRQLGSGTKCPPLTTQGVVTKRLNTDNSSSLKTNFGYVNLNRIPSFKQMNADLRNKRHANAPDSNEQLPSANYRGRPGERQTEDINNRLNRLKLTGPDDSPVTTDDLGLAHSRLNNDTRQVAHYDTSALRNDTSSSRTPACQHPSTNPLETHSHLLASKASAAGSRSSPRLEHGREAKPEGSGGDWSAPVALTPPSNSRLLNSTPVEPQGCRYQSAHDNRSGCYYDSNEQTTDKSAAGKIHADNNYYYYDDESHLKLPDGANYSIDCLADDNYFSARETVPIDSSNGRPSLLPRELNNSHIHCNCIRCYEQLQGVVKYGYHDNEVYVTNNSSPCVCCRCVEWMCDSPALSAASAGHSLPAIDASSRKTTDDTTTATTQLAYNIDQRAQTLSSHNNRFRYSQNIESTLTVSELIAPPRTSPNCFEQQDEAGVEGEPKREPSAAVSGQPKRVRFALDLHGNMKHTTFYINKDTHSPIDVHHNSVLTQHLTAPQQPDVQLITTHTSGEISAAKVKQAAASAKLVISRTQPGTGVTRQTSYQCIPYKTDRQILDLNNSAESYTSRDSAVGDNKRTIAHRSSGYDSTDAGRHFDDSFQQEAIAASHSSHARNSHFVSTATNDHSMISYPSQRNSPASHDAKLQTNVCSNYRYGSPQECVSNIQQYESDVAYLRDNMTDTRSHVACDGQERQNAWRDVTEATQLAGPSRYEVEARNDELKALHLYRTRGPPPPYYMHKHRHGNQLMTSSTRQLSTSTGLGLESVPEQTPALSPNSPQPISGSSYLHKQLPEVKAVDDIWVRNTFREHACADESTTTHHNRSYDAAPSDALQQPPNAVRLARSNSIHTFRETEAVRPVDPVRLRKPQFASSNDIYKMLEAQRRNPLAYHEKSPYKHFAESSL